MLVFVGIFLFLVIKSYRHHFIQGLWIVLVGRGIRNRRIAPSRSSSSTDGGGGGNVFIVGSMRTI